MDLLTQQLAALSESLNGPFPGQISHGLNLTLKLKDPNGMLAALIEIRKRQRKIDSGLGELNFVHFARFLPTYDNTALQVITEFDGPLEAYVLDFVIEIGDVFDALLGLTEGTEHIVPVADHPAEFLAFVQKHNTITVPGLGSVVDWPLYSAYRDTTVLDIVGPRDDLPIPKEDRWATPIDRDDVQGNILRSFNADRVRHFLLGVVDPSEARQWLRDRATPDAGAPAAVVKVTSFRPWAAEAKPKLMLNIGLTYNGMVALEIRPQWRDPFPESFKQGALQRAKDNFDVDGNDPSNWWLGGPDQAASIHVMVSLYRTAGAEAEFDLAAAALVASLPAGGLKLVDAQDAMSRGGQSWFRYADGIANPRIAVASPPPGERDRDLQAATTPGEFILGANHKNIYGGPSIGNLPDALAGNGSFCAVRVLAQDTDLFTNTLMQEAARLNVDLQWLAAKLMGRWFEGAPLNLHPAAASADPAENLRNDFDYTPSYEYPGVPSDDAGHRCPIGAHIRRANPRSSRLAGARYARRLMRRGMHYEIPRAEGKREVGLFGMFMCADLERQFEFIQREWINGDRFVAGIRGMRDPFVGTPPAEGHRFEIPMDNGPVLQVRLPQLVHTRGSVYLFMPGLAALRKLEDFAKTDPASPVRSMVPPDRSKAGDDAIERAARLRLIPDYVSVIRRMVQYQEALKSVGATPLTETELIEGAWASVGKASTRSAVRASSPGGLVFDPRRRGFQMDPYPVFAAFRRREPVHFSPLYNAWFVFGYDDVLSVCNDNDGYSATDPASKHPPGLFTLDDPEHAAVLKLVAAAWNQAQANYPNSIQQSIDRTLASLDARDSFDVVDDLARPLPRDIYFDILGGAALDAATRLELDQLARAVMKHHDHLMDEAQQFDGMVAAFQLGNRLGAMLVAAKDPKSPFTGTFLHYLSKVVDWITGPFTPRIAGMTLVNLTVAGYMSVEFLLATGIRRLLLGGGSFWRVLKEDPAQVDKLLRELRRTSHALSVIDRFAKKDVTLSGVRIRKDQSVFGVLASANRDERVFGADADVFNPNRAFPKPHLGLGAGVHVCMGRYLEPLITAPALTALAAAMPNLRLQSNAQPPWFENFYFRSFDHLRVSAR